MAHNAEDSMRNTKHKKMTKKKYTFIKFILKAIVTKERFKQMSL